MTPYSEVAKKTWFSGRFEFQRSNPWVRRLPAEIWDRILSFLEPSDAILLASTCRFLQSVAFRHRKKGCAKEPSYSDDDRDWWASFRYDYTPSPTIPFGWFEARKQRQKRENAIRAEVDVFTPLVRDARRPQFHQNGFEIEWNDERPFSSDNEDDDSWYVGRKHLFEF